MRRDPKLEAAKKQLRAAAEEAAFFKRQSEAYAQAIVSMADDLKAARETNASTSSAAVWAKRYEVALLEVRALVRDREKFIALGPRVLVAIENVLNAVLP